MCRRSRDVEHESKSTLAVISSAVNRALPRPLWPGFSTRIRIHKGTQAGSFSRGEQFCDQTTGSEQRAYRQRQASFYLVAAMLASQAPLAEVLTVVGQQPIAVLAYPGAGPSDHLPLVIFRWYAGHNSHGSSCRKARERNLFHRSSAQPFRESRVVHHLASADVDSVVCVAATLSDNVSTQLRF